MAKLSYVIGIVNETYGGIVNIDQLSSTDKRGAAVDLTALACDLLKIPCQFQLGDTAVYGEKLNGSWTGVLGDIQAGRYNSALPVFTLTSDLVDDFSAPSVPLGIPLYWVTRKSETVEMYSLRALIRPLSWRVWLMILATLVTLSLIIVVSQTFRPPVLNNKRVPVRRPHDILAFTTVFVNIGVYLVRKGPVMRNLPVSSKILQLFWGICALLMIASYTGGLLSSMFKMESKPPFQDLPTLIDCLNAQLCRMIFSSPKDDWLLKEIDNKASRYASLKVPLGRNLPLLVPDTTDRIAEVEGNRQIFLVTAPDAIGGFVPLLKGRCSVALIKDNVDDAVSMPFPKGDPYGRQFNKQLRNLEEFGITRKILGRYAVHNDCGNMGRAKKPTAPPVPIRLALGAIIILASGCLLAMVTLMTENFTHYCVPPKHLWEVGRMFYMRNK